MDLLAAARAADSRIRAYVRRTPLELSLPLSERLGTEVHLKLENFQITGSFKVRGAMSRLLALTPEEKKRGVIAASSGNHGLGVAYGLSRLGVGGRILVPQNAVAGKVAAIRRYGAEVETFGATCEQSEAEARRRAEKDGSCFLSPYNDAAVIAGQGTVGLEIAGDLEEPADVAFIAVGGGGLLSGVGGVLKSLWPGVRVVGCSPSADCAMANSLQAGKIVEMETTPTLSDGTAGGIEPGSLTFPLCQGLIDDFMLVSEAEIRDALLWTIDTHRFLIEGAAATAIAGLVKYASQGAPFQRAVVVLCGGNFFLDRLRAL